MAKIIIFGVQDFAELAHYYLTNDSEHEVVAFCVDEKYIPESKTFRDLPVVAFEQVEHEFPPESHQFFAPMSPQRMNRLREEIYYKIKQKNYQIKCLSLKNNPIARIYNPCFYSQKKRTPRFLRAFKPHIKLLLVRSFFHEMGCHLFS